jgi:hypothetical protein
MTIFVMSLTKFHFLSNRKVYIHISQQHELAIAALFLYVFCVITPLDMPTELLLPSGTFSTVTIVATLSKIH